MSSRHADPALTVRPPAELTARAKQVLGGHSREMRGFITACLAALNANPAAFLAQLEEYWPANKPRGRPRRPSLDPVTDQPTEEPDPGGEPATPAAASVTETAAEPPVVGPVGGPGSGDRDGGGRRRPSVFGREVERPEPVDADTARLEREPDSSRWRVVAGLASDPGTVVVVGVLEPVYGTGRRVVRSWEAYHGHVRIPGGPWRTRRDAVGHLLLHRQRLAGP